MKISSNKIASGGRIPEVYTCNGKNINPPLEFEDLPDNVKSLALIMTDDSMPGRPTVNWILWNIDINLRKIEEGSVPEGVSVGINDFDDAKYTGPCPPENSSHDYTFTMFALDNILELEENANISDLRKAMEGHILEEASLTATFERTSREIADVNFNASSRETGQNI